MQQAQIVVRVVEDLLDFVALEDAAQGGGLADGQRIEHRGELARAHLQQVDSIDEPVEAGAFGVHCNGAALLHGGQKAIGGGCCVDVRWFVHGQPFGHVYVLTLLKVCYPKLSSWVTEREGLRACSAFPLR